MRSVIFVMLAALIFIGGCSKSEKIVDKTTVDSAYVRTDKYLSDYVGKDFIKKYLAKLPAKFTLDSSGFKVSYFEKIEILGYSDTIVFALDKNLRITNANKIKGLPDCVASPEACEFKVDSASVVKILKDKNYPSGIKPWKIKSYWDDAQRRFFWGVTITESEIVRPQMERAEGLKIIIDPATGEIISEKTWRIL